jgi:hypothetical protein
MTFLGVFVILKVPTFLLCHSERAPSPLLSFWTSFLARKNPYGNFVGLRCETYIAYQRWFAQGVRRIIHFVQNDILLGVFVILKVPTFLLCHSERAPSPLLSFWTSFLARKNPYGNCVDYGVKHISPIKDISPKEYTVFFTSFRMTYSGYYIKESENYIRTMVPVIIEKISENLRDLREIIF